jgi:hypothetical protein
VWPARPAVDGHRRLGTTSGRKFHAGTVTVTSNCSAAMQAVSDPCGASAARPHHRHHGCCGGPDERGDGLEGKGVIVLPLSDKLRYTSAKT